MALRSLATLLCAGAAASLCLGEGAAAAASISALQWNPHWQCWGNTACAANASAALTKLLTTQGTYLR